MWLLWRGEELEVVDKFIFMMLDSYGVICEDVSQN